MITVADASVIVDLLIDDPVDLELANALATSDIHAPALLDFEVTSALRGHLLARNLTPARVAIALNDFAALDIERHQMTAVLPVVIDHAHNFTAYDAAYIVLALALDAPLLTADVKLEPARKLGIAVEVHGSPA